MTSLAVNSCGPQWLIREANIPGKADPVQYSNSSVGELVRKGSFPFCTRRTSFLTSQLRFHSEFAQYVNWSGSWVYDTAVRSRCQQSRDGFLSVDDAQRQSKSSHLKENFKKKSFTVKTMRTCATLAGIWLNSQDTDYSQISTSQFVALLHPPVTLVGTSFPSFIIQMVPSSFTPIAMIGSLRGAFLVDWLFLLRKWDDVHLCQ